MIKTLTSEEAFAISKAIKQIHGIRISDIIRCNYADFYKKVKINGHCDNETERTIIGISKAHNENLDELKELGYSILNKEKQFKEIKWHNILLGLRRKLNLTQKDLSELLKVQKGRISDWECNKKLPSYKNCENLMNFIYKENLDLSELFKLGELPLKRKRPSETSLQIVKTNELSELIGILNGDGSISKSGLIEISGSLIEDLEHHQRNTKNLIKRIFFKNTTLSKEGSVIKTSFTSLQIAKSLSKLGVPLGKKRILEIPIFINENNEFLRSYLRGLFDTDGCICKRNKYNIRISFGSFVDANFADSIKSSLRKIKLSSTKRFHPEGRVAIDLYNDLDVISFFQIIGSSNPSKIAKFLHWRLIGICPKENYPIVKNELKIKFGIDLDTFSLPFFWNEKYIKSLPSKAKERLLEKLHDDMIKLNFVKIRGKINWKVIMTELKSEFSLKQLTNEFECSYKTIWQWEVGSRRPNLNMIVKIVEFLNAHKINLESLSP